MLKISTVLKLYHSQHSSYEIRLTFQNATDIITYFCVVSIATGYGMDDRGVGVRVPVA
jgi:hypothetical protein